MGAPVLLIVGADGERREALCSLMRSEGYTVVVVSSAAEAADELEAGLAPDAILADLGTTGRLPSRSERAASEGTTISFDVASGPRAQPGRGLAVLRRPMDGSRVMNVLDRLPPPAAC